MAPKTARAVKGERVDRRATKSEKVNLRAVKSEELDRREVKSDKKVNRRAIKTEKVDRREVRSDKKVNRRAIKTEKVDRREVCEMFNDEGLQLIEGYERGADFIKVDCGCTLKKYGDFGGRLRVDATGKFSIDCQCFVGCTKGKFPSLFIIKLNILTPDEFEKHTEKGGSKRWQYNIWIQTGGKKIPLLRSALFKYYAPAANADNATSVGSRKRKFHRDEFVHCSLCNKERRFQLRNKEECKLYHDAAINENWKCSDWPGHNITCKEADERASRKAYRGCPRQLRCQGCFACVCLGCYKCRYLECTCRLCTDFVQNVDA
ncbi:hypothetical protein L6164_022546 [Bauhinia variegata]|uniref:Uncharacterized protein n=1 Tax=Bauhinia variegata TaxID=167791 RepID=A0ACB9MIW4_BAUVA|nr:hypothetical protein L6164_022546 [Bauhinia variegata]